MKPTMRTTVVAAAAVLLALSACGSDDPAEAETVVETEDELEAEDEASDLQAARDGLASFLAENPLSNPLESSTIPGCPAISAERMEQALAEVGYPDAPLEGWATEIEWSAYQDLHPDLMGIVCTGDSGGEPDSTHGIFASGVVAVDLADLADFEDLLPDLGTSATPEAAPEGLSGEVASGCPEPEFCVAAWHQDGLVIGVPLMAEAADEETATALLVDVLPDVLATLAEN